VPGNRRGRHGNRNPHKEIRDQVALLNAAARGPAAPAGDSSANFKEEGPSEELKDAHASRCGPDDDRHRLK
jgi:hypothetical protein